MSILSKLQALITAANTKTGESDTTLTDAMQTLVDGYGQGGGDNTKYLNLIARSGTSFEDNTIITAGGRAFSMWHNLQTLSLPNLDTIGDSCFQNCENIDNFYLPKLTTIGSANAFSGAGKTTSAIVLPLLSQIPSMNAINSFKGKAVDLGASIRSIAGYMFNGSTNLNVLVLRKETLVPLGNINAFTNTPFASDGSGGTLYVPSSLVSSYESETNWITILGYTNNSIATIEGSQYENYYADGTPIS